MVYLLHFDAPLHRARHYVGWSQNGHTLRSRLEAHRTGQGARLMRAVCLDHGIDFQLARVWKGPRADRNFECHIKNRKNAPKLCPICNPSTWTETRNP